MSAPRTLVAGRQLTTGATGSCRVVLAPVGRQCMRGCRSLPDWSGGRFERALVVDGNDRKKKSALAEQACTRGI